jgi:hypothetical protein
MPLIHFQDQHFFIFNSALAIAQHNPRISSSASLYLSSACIILNTALAYHLLGRHHGSPECLRKAASMYKGVANLLILTAGVDGIAFLVRSAAINNLSHILYGQGNFQQVKDSLTELTALACTSRDISSALVTPNADEWVGFRMNIMSASSLDLAPAA